MVCVCVRALWGCSASVAVGSSPSRPAVLSCCCCCYRRCAVRTSTMRPSVERRSEETPMDLSLASLLVLVVACVLSPWSALGAAAAASCSVSSAGASIASPVSAGSSPFLVSRSLLESASTPLVGSTVLFTGAPLRRDPLAQDSSSAAPTITSFDVMVTAVPTTFLLQLYSPIVDPLTNATTLTLSRSLQQSYNLGTAVGAKRIAVVWPYQDGDLVALAVPPNMPPSVPFEDAASSTSAAAALLPNSWVSVWEGPVQTTIGAALPCTNGIAAVQRAYRSEKRGRYSHARARSATISEALTPLSVTHDFLFACLKFRGECESRVCVEF